MANQGKRSMGRGTSRSINVGRGSEMTVEEAGRKGGETVARKYGHEHFEEIGRKGGETVSERYGHEHFEEIGRKGGETVSNKYGHEHFEEIGHKGGQKVRDLIERGKQSEGRRR